LIGKVCICNQLMYFKYFVPYLRMMSEEKEVYAQDKIVEKIHKEEGLDENDNNYNVSEALSDSNQQDAEKDNTAT
jgi:hypothetical protein